MIENNSEKIFRETTGEEHTSQVPDDDARHYIHCCGDTTAVAASRYAKLFAASRDTGGGLETEQTQAILDTDEPLVALPTTTEILLGIGNIGLYLDFDIYPQRPRTRNLTGRKRSNPGNALGMPLTTSS